MDIFEETRIADDLDRRQLRKYLLGAIESEEEIKKIELRILEDDNYNLVFDEIEEALIDDYVNELLNAQDLKLFSKNFILTATRQQKINEARKLWYSVRSKME